jgi:hypothetical protein
MITQMSCDTRLMAMSRALRGIVTCLLRSDHHVHAVAIKQAISVNPGPRESRSERGDRLCVMPLLQKVSKQPANRLTRSAD